MLTATTRVHQAGPMTAWNEFRLAIPGLPPAAKQFLKEPLAMNGMEISLNSMLPGQGMPFVHRHRENEETYLFLSGTGEFQADGEVFAIEPGTCVCCAPEVGRSWRNTGADELLFVVIQTPNQPMATSTVADGERVDEPLCWVK
ncbi:cupin domain-containing protein [Aeoliella sp. SH292]|uniref:cupin domain-containing protein n=1 Tax=Aeoliella sp. SH292 TaxID=3454464 RepID=UPI003F9AB6AA